MSLSSLILITEKPESLQAQDRAFSSLEHTMMPISYWAKRDKNNCSAGLLLKAL